MTNVSVLGTLYHGGESRDLNDRVHGISCRYSDNTNKQTQSYFSLYPTDFHKTKRTYLLIIRSKRSSESYSTMCSSFPHKSEQTLFFGISTLLVLLRNISIHCGKTLKCMVTRNNEEVCALYCIIIG